MVLEHAGTVLPSVRPSVRAYFQLSPFSRHTLHGCIGVLRPGGAYLRVGLEVCSLRWYG